MNLPRAAGQDIFGNLHRQQLALDRPFVPSVPGVIAVRRVCDHEMHALIRNRFQDVHAVAPNYDVFLHCVFRQTRHFSGPGEILRF